MFNFQQWISLLGIIPLLFITWLCSNNKRKFPWRVVIWGTILQFVFAFFVLKTNIGFTVFDYLGQAVKSTLDFTNAGADFVFGDLGNWAKGTGPLGFFAFRVLPTIIFVASVMSILYYLKVMQFVVGLMAKVMTFFMGVSGAESLSCAANVFMGQTEAPLVIKPYVPKMTESELLVLMVVGMATIAGGVRAAYVGLGVDARHLITASVLSAPAALVAAKIIIPETEEPLTRGVIKITVEPTDVNIIDAAANGASDGLKLALNVAAMLIAFLAVIALGDTCLKWVGTIFGKVFVKVGLEGYDWVSFLVNGKLTLDYVFGVFMWPFAWLMGVPQAECFQVGVLLGQKVVANEFVAYLNFSNIIKNHPEMLSQRAQIIVTYALCGFANFSSIGIQLGGIGGLAPGRRHDLARLGIKALIGGTIASYMTANIAGVFIQ